MTRLRLCFRSELIAGKEAVSWSIGELGPHRRGRRAPAIEARSRGGTPVVGQFAERQQRDHRRVPGRPHDSDVRCGPEVAVFTPFTLMLSE